MNTPFPIVAVKAFRSITIILTRVHREHLFEINYSTIETFYHLPTQVKNMATANRTSLEMG